jgi:hypothetical protein
MIVEAKVARWLQVAGCRLQVADSGRADPIERWLQTPNSKLQTSNGEGEKRRPENKDGAVQTLREIERLGN